MHVKLCNGVRKCVAVDQKKGIKMYIKERRWKEN